jgi:hypothetical protein
MTVWPESITPPPTSDRWLTNDPSEGVGRPLKVFLTAFVALRLPTIKPPVPA